MNTITRTSCAATLLLAGSYTMAQPPFPVDTFITNDVSSPIPVTGTVSSSVSGTVEVGGNSLDDLNDKLDSLIETVGAVETRIKPANFARAWSREDLAAISVWPVSLDQPVLVSFITVSAENDSGAIRFCATSSCSLAEAVIAVGHKNKEFPGVLVMSLPQPVKIQGFQWRCDNTVEDCEVKVSIIGTVEND